MRFLVLIGCMFLSINAFSLTRGEIIEQIRFQIRDTTNTTTSNHWSTDILNKRVNIVHRDIAVMTKCLYKQYFTTAVAETAEYTLPSDCFKIDVVAILNQSSTTATNRFVKLKRYTKAGLYREYTGGWENQPSGIPTKYYEERNKVGFVPKFSATYASTGCIQINYFASATDMTADSDVPWGGEYFLYGFHDLIVDGVVAMCKKDEGTADWATLRAEYQSNVALMKTLIKNQPDTDSYIEIDLPK